MTEWGSEVVAGVIVAFLAMAMIAATGSGRNPYAHEGAVAAAWRVVGGGVFSGLLVFALLYWVL